MASQTLAEAQKLITNEIVSGIVQDIITVNPFYNVLPFQGYSGQALLVSRENALGDSQFLAVDGTITAKAAATFTQVPYTATKILGDVEIDGLVQAQSTSAGVDQMAIEISSKAKSIGRAFQNGLVNGTGVSPQMNSFHSMCDASQYTTASAGQALSFALLDELVDKVVAKDGAVDFIMMPERTLRSFKVLLRALGGASIDEVLTLPDGSRVLTYNGIPVYKNQWMVTTETANGAALTGGALTSVYAGCVDDGSAKVGVAAIHPDSVPAGVEVKMVGEMESKDSSLIRIRQYANAILYNRRGLARLTSINN